MADEDNVAVEGADAGDSDPQVELDTLKVEHERLKKSAAREASGRDRKITELTEQLEAIQAEQKQARRASATPKELERLQAEERAQEDAARNAKLIQAETRVAELEAAVAFNKKVGELGLPSVIHRVLTDMKPSDPDEQDDWLAGIKEDVDLLIYQEQSKFRVSKSPQTGDKGRTAPTDREWDKWTVEQREEYVKTLPIEQRMKMIQQDVDK